MGRIKFFFGHPIIAWISYCMKSDPPPQKKKQNKKRIETNGHKITTNNYVDDEEIIKFQGILWHWHTTDVCSAKG